MNPRNSKRGILLLGVLGGLILLSGMGALVLFLMREGKGTPKDPSEALIQAKIAYADGAFEIAEEILRPLLAARPDDSGLRLFRGKLLLELGSLREARATFDGVHRDHPEIAETLLGLAACHERSGEHELVEACLRRASEMKKGDWKILHDLALVQYKAGETMAALFTAKQSLRARKGQEDLSKLMDEIGLNRQARADLARPNPRHPQGFDPFEMPDTHPPDPWEGLPRPGFTDPGVGTPRPGRTGPR